MKKLLFSIVAVMMLAGCFHYDMPESTPVVLLTIDDIKDGIIEYETKEIPLFLQKHSAIHSITIDSLVIIREIEPYSGYLSTTWDLDEEQNLSTSQWAANGYKDKYIRKTKTVLVKVDEIKTSTDGTFSWKSDWVGAYLEVKRN